MTQSDIVIYEDDYEKIIEGKNIYGISHIGTRLKNEDNISAKKIECITLLSIADGIGGYSEGKFASKTAIKTLEDFIFDNYNSLSTGMKEYLIQAHLMAHGELKRCSYGIREPMGTTLSSALIKDDKYVIGNTGDSRTYLIRSGEIILKTKDHSIVQTMIENNQITEYGVKNHPMRNILTYAVGLDDFKFKVDTYEGNFKSGDILLLSSDGLHGYVDDRKLLNIVENYYPSLEQIAKSLLDTALKNSKDNISILLYIHQ